MLVVGEGVVNKRCGTQAAEGGWHVALDCSFSWGEWLACEVNIGRVLLFMRFIEKMYAFSLCGGVTLH